MTHVSHGSSLCACHRKSPRVHVVYRCIPGCLFGTHLNQRLSSHVCVIPPAWCCGCARPTQNGPGLFVQAHAPGKTSFITRRLHWWCFTATRPHLSDPKQSRGVLYRSHLGSFPGIRFGCGNNRTRSETGVVLHIYISECYSCKLVWCIQLPADSLSAQRK